MHRPHWLRSAFVLTVLLAFLSGTPAPAQEQPVRIGIAGDSTVRDYINTSGSYADLRGWGQYVGEYLGGKAQVKNHAKGGCSSKSFINEGRWQALLAEEPDYVLIQFGHNDNPNKGPERETKPNEVPLQLPPEGLGSHPMDWYRNNIRTYIQEARAAGTTPIIVTPMERRVFTTNGQRARAKNKPWAEAAIAVAREMDAAVIDLNAFSAELLNRLGPEGTLFMHPTREGELDNTHFNEAGARVYAEFIVEELAKVAPELAPLVTLPATRTIDREKATQSP